MLRRVTTGEEKAVNIEEKLEEFLTQLLHDMGNMLHVASANLEFARLNLSKDEPDLTDLEKCVNGAYDAVQYTAQLMTYTRQVAKKQLPEYHPETLGITDIARKTSSICSALLRKSDIKVDVTPYHKDRQVEELYFTGDHVRTVVVMFNMFSNMNRALEGYESSEPKKIEIEIEYIDERYKGNSQIQAFFEKESETGQYSRNGYALMKVSNNGPPIPEDILDHIFECNVSGNNSSGLGLAVCREFVEDRFRGKMVIDNIEGGVAYYVLLPLCNQEEARSLRM